MKIGVDIGGTQVKIGFVNNLDIIYKYAIDTNKETLFSDIAESIKSELKKLNLEESDIEGIGFGLPGNVIDGYINFLPNVGIKNYDIYETMMKYFPGIKLASGNDATVAALGESMVNHLDNAVFVTLGTGVGGGIVINGEVIYGVHGASGEFGHMRIDEKHLYHCTCGRDGCLETIASATGIVRLANEYLLQYPDSVLNKMPKFSCKDVIDGAKEQDSLCLKVFNEACDALGKVLAGVAVVVDPDCFIIGGGVSKAGKFLLDGINEAYKKYAHYAVRDISFKLATLGNDAGILGAALLL